MRKIVCTGVLLLALSIVNSGCALIGTALGAGAAYGIYMATKK